MPILTDRDFAKLASAVAQDYVEHGTPLNDSIDKIASKYDMNEEQLCRMCEASNNATFNALFQAKGKEASADRIVEFDVAKPKEILSRRVGQAKQAQVKTAQVRPSFDAVWESRPLAGPALEEEKTASVKTAEDEMLEQHLERRAALRDARTLDKTLEHLRHEKIAAEISYGDALDKLYFHFRAVDRKPQFHGFEKDAMALHGEDASEPLDTLRRRLGMPAVNRDFSKVASRVVANAKGNEYALLKVALDAAERRRQIQSTLTHHARG